MLVRFMRTYNEFQQGQAYEMTPEQAEKIFNLGATIAYNDDPFHAPSPIVTIDYGKILFDALDMRNLERILK